MSARHRRPDIWPGLLLIGCAGVMVVTALLIHFDVLPGFCLSERGFMMASKCRGM